MDVAPGTFVAVTVLVLASVFHSLCKELEQSGERLEDRTTDLTHRLVARRFVDKQRGCVGRELVVKQ